jgi:hypothetical protein
MAFSASTSCTWSVSLQTPVGSQSPGAHEEIRIYQPGDDSCPGYSNLTITLHRTIRVPDNSQHYDLPLIWGRFPSIILVNMRPNCRRD